MTAIYGPHSWARIFARVEAEQALEDAAERASRARLERLIGRLRAANEQHVNDTASAIRALIEGE